MWAQWYHLLFCRKTQKKEIGSGGGEENAHIVVFRGCPKMHPDENAHIIVNPSAAGTDWGDFGVAGNAYIVVNRAPQAQNGRRSRRRHKLGLEGAAGA